MPKCLFLKCQFSHASLHRSAAYSESLVLSNWPVVCGDRCDAELDDCLWRWSHSIVKWSRKESHWEGMSRERKRRIARKPDCLNSGRAKLPAHSFDFSMGNSCAGHIRKHVCQILPSAHWNACGSPRSIPNACFGSTWERVHGLREKFLLPEVCCQPMSILFSPQAHVEDRNNLFKNVPHPLRMLWLKWMRHVFAEKVWCQILSWVLCVVEGPLSSWSLS